MAASWLIYAATFLGSMLFVHLLYQLELIPWRLKQGQLHWTEEARQLWLVRCGELSKHNLLPIGLGALSHLYAPQLYWPGIMVAAYTGARFGDYPLDRAVYPKLTLRDWFSITAKNFCIRLVTQILVVLVAIVMPTTMSSAAWALAGGFLAIQLGLNFGLGIMLMAQLRLIYPASPRLAELVNQTSTRLGIPVRRTWEIAGANANALAFIATKEIGFTRVLLELCSDEEIKSICAHELGHLRESRSMLLARLCTQLFLLPLIFIRPMQAAYGSGGIALLLLLVFLIWLSRFLFSQRLEREADQTALANTLDPITYARALEKLHQQNRIPSVVSESQLTTHPHLYDRLLAAGVTPDYPRPRPPNTFNIPALLISLLTALLVVQSFRS